MASAESHAETPDTSDARPAHAPKRRWRLPRRYWRHAPLVLAVLLLLGWALLPAAHGLSLIQNVRLGASAPPASAAGIPVQDVRFAASDGALAAHPADYQRVVLAFLAAYLPT